MQLSFSTLLAENVSLLTRERAKELGDMELVKMWAESELSYLELPKAAAQKLKDILENDQIQLEEFMKEFSSIIESSNNPRWQAFLVFKHFPTTVFNYFSSLSFVEFIILLSGSILFFFFIKYLFTGETKKSTWLYKNLFVRVCSFGAYLLPYVYLQTMHYKLDFDFSYIKEAKIINAIPIRNFFNPPVIKVLTYIYTTYNNQIIYAYFFLCIFCVIRAKLPQNRYIRFHIMSGLLMMILIPLIDQMVGILAFLYFYYPSAGRFLTYNEAIARGATVDFVKYSLETFLLSNLMYNALTLTYPFKFYRDAVEISLGRDNKNKD